MLEVQGTVIRWLGALIAGSTVAAAIGAIVSSL